MSNLVVLIPHYNNTEELYKTILSIDETFSVDLVIVDDGSKTPPSLSEIEKIYSGKGTIILHMLPENQGIEKALNFGLGIIKNSHYKYIGRIDAGDLSHKNKFLKQIEYLNANPEVFLLGTWGDIVDQDGKFIYTLKHPTDYESIKKRMYFNSCFLHPSVVFRAEILESIGFYPENRKSAEDYAYFFNILKKYKVENLPESLIDYVISENSVSTTKRKQQIKSRINTILDHFYFGYYPIVGLIRNTLLYFTSRSMVIKIKSILKIEH